MFKGGGFQVIGRRKRAVARVTVRPGKGGFVVNGRTPEDYFGRETLRMIINQPGALVGGLETVDITAQVDGGGLSGQAGALRLGIARAINRQEPEKRPALKAAGFLSRDAREVERKKYGKHKARKAPQFSKR